MNAQEWNLPREGGCRCGQVRIRITAPPLLSMACHCTGCQRMSASAFSLSLAIPSAGFAVIAGEPVIGGLHGKTHHYFCPHCMSWMFTRPEGLDFFVNVRSTMLDDTRGIAPFVETYMDEKLPFASTGARHSFGTFPSFEKYDALIAEYTEHRRGNPG
ncbi:MAG: GFA family protein [Polyangiaceae bacterium]|nr:GFA family protein [Polyangiaceae bacterium]